MRGHAVSDRPPVEPIRRRTRDQDVMDRPVRLIRNQSIRHPAAFG